MAKYSLQFIIPIAFSLLLAACSKGGGGNSSNTYAQCTSALNNTTQSAAAETLQAMDELELLSENADRWIVGLSQEQLRPSGKTIKNYKVVNKTFSVRNIHSKLLSIEINKGADKSDVLKNILDYYPVEYIEPDHLNYTLDIENTTFNDRSHWGHNTINTTSAWMITKGQKDIVVAVIDSGVDFKHPDLTATRWRNTKEVVNGKDDDNNGLVDDLYGWNYVNNNNKPYPHKNVKNDYHGTHVAGIISGKKTSNAAGVAPNVKLMSLRFLNDQKSGYTSNAVKSIYYAVDNGAKIINASFGSYKKSTAMINAINYAQSKGVLIIAAAGNLGQDNDKRPFYPASYKASNIIAVTASTSNDRWLSGINYGDHSVDIAAPGSRIQSTDQNDGYRSRSGSSMAAPFVAGVAALALSANSNLSGEQLKTIVLDLAENIPQLGSKAKDGRRLNAAKSVQKAYSTSYGEFVPPSCEV